MKRRSANILVLTALLIGRSLAGAQTTAGQQPAPPMPAAPVLKSPVESFRTLLAMPSQERKTFLASRSAPARERLLAKIREYQALTPEARELRFKATELRWYLQIFMAMPATNRPAELALLPDNVRDLVATRLQQWDRLPPAAQELLRTNQQSATFFARVTAPANLPPEPPGALLQQHLTERLNKLFELTPAEEQAILASLSDAERKQMEKTLEAFRSLTAAQKRQCVVSFRSFAGMSVPEKQEFLRNAERWSQMSPSDRQAWRELVNMAPALPPLPLVNPPKPPPLPVDVKKNQLPFATNGG